MAVAEMVAASTSSSSDNNASMEESSEDHQLINNNEEEEEAGEIINVEEVDIVIPNNEVEIDIATTASLEEEEEKSAEKSSATDNRHYEDERSEDEKDAVVVQAMIDGEGDEGNVVFYGNHTDTDYADADADAEDEEEEEDESDSISTTIITSATERDLTSEYKTLPTTYCCKGNRGASNGMMFNLKPKKRLILHEMSFHTWMTGAVGIEVWVKKGNYRGYEQKPGSWTKWVTNTQGKFCCDLV